MPKLHESNVLVTGGNRGIGRGIAKALADEGARVAVNHPPGSDEHATANDVVDEITEDGGRAMSLAGDVSDAASARSMIESFEEQWGPMEVLVNNAGILTQSELAEMPIDMWDETIAVDLRGVFLTTRFALPGMLDAGTGAIVNVASQLGIKGAAELVHYSAAKGGVISFTRALAREVSPTVRVNAIAPGPVSTDMLNGISAVWREEKKAELPMDRFGRVKDIAPTAVFLANEQSSYYTGQVLSPDGGDAMH
jgi:3-oxoacyl-[acyl-carrier protein] reductase